MVAGGEDRATLAWGGNRAKTESANVCVHAGVLTGSVSIPKFRC